MEDSPAAQLIEVEFGHPEFAELLNDIRDFDWGIINKLRKTDLERVSSTGFKFVTKGLENQRMELKQFLFNHPSCMASGFETIMDKLKLFARLCKPKITPVVPSPVVPQHKHLAIKEEKRKKLRVIRVDEEEEDDDFEELIGSETDEEEEEERKPRRRWGKR